MAAFVHISFMFLLLEYVEFFCRELGKDSCGGRGGQWFSATKVLLLLLHSYEDLYNVMPPSSGLPSKPAPLLLGFFRDGLTCGLMWETQIARCFEKCF